MKNNKDILKDFDYESVLITDDYFTDITKKDVDFLNTFNPDRLLYNFRLTAGYKPEELKEKGPYSGWENTRIGGHTLGHYLTAAAQGVKNGFHDSKGKDGITLSQRLNKLIDGLEDCQNKNDKAVDDGNINRNYGFIFGATMAEPEKPELQFEKVKSTSAADTWVPWYTLHKIINGLVETYKLTENKKALSIVLKLGEWVYNHTSKWTEEEKERVLRIEYGGMNDCLYELYLICKEINYENIDHIKYAAHSFDEESLFEKIIAYKNGSAQDVLNNHHANCTIPKFVGALNGYKATGNEKYLNAAKAFWDLVVEHHTYITGGNSECEHFGLDDVLDLERSNCNCETCNTHNMLKFTKELFKLTGEIKYADFYERTYLNAIMASVNAETGMTAYFQPMATGCFKNYCNPDVEKNYFWCCTGTGLENFTKLNDSLYFHNENEIYSNVFISSAVNWKEKEVEIIQTTDIPETDIVQYKIKTSKNNNSFTICIRVPYWSKSTPEVLINNKPINANVCDGFIKINNEWNDGDIITYKIPLGLQAYNLPDNYNHSFGFMYGPLVLAANLGSDTQMNIRQVGVLCDVSANKLVFGKLMPLNGNYGGTSNLKVLPGEILTIKTSVSDFMENISQHLIKKDGLCFQLEDTDCSKKLIFTPYYKINSGRYGIYWIFKDERSRDICAQIYTEETKNYIDGIGVGYGSQTEGNSETWPCLQEEGSGSQADSGELSRFAYNGGNFSYLLKVEKNHENFIKLTVMGTACTENEKQVDGTTLSVYVIQDNKKVILEEFTLTMAGEKQVKEIQIPSSIINNSYTFKDEGFNVIRVYFEGKNGAQSAKLIAPLETYFN